MKHLPNNIIPWVHFISVHHRDGLKRVTSTGRIPFLPLKSITKHSHQIAKEGGELQLPAMSLQHYRFLGALGGGGKRGNSPPPPPPLEVVVVLDDPAESPPRRSNDVGFDDVLVGALLKVGFAPRPGIEMENVWPSLRL